ncbi:hypothetical protein CMI37_17760 [Candidatus Pacearchaeota archaeon]|nr:hypothetical protein [Candidatus Pacearchaeota archaeon]|tara:strand:+ start:408 stop:821 length:414 start_codon:yes stop_codon:yes gene_type:complete
MSKRKPLLDYALHEIPEDKASQLARLAVLAREARQAGWHLGQAITQKFDLEQELREEGWAVVQEPSFVKKEQATIEISDENWEWVQAEAKRVGKEPQGYLEELLVKGMKRNSLALALPGQSLDEAINMNMDRWRAEE